ncbi:MAG TPA: hypothetical protein VGD49_00025, partial [Longimicrobiales bacterium]
KIGGISTVMPSASQAQAPRQLCAEQLPVVAVMPNNTLERACSHRGRAALAINCVLAGAEWAPCQAAQLNR